MQTSVVYFAMFNPRSGSLPRACLLALAVLAAMPVDVVRAQSVPTVTIAMPMDGQTLATARPVITGTVSGAMPVDGGMASSVELRVGTTVVMVAPDGAGDWMYTPPVALPQGPLTIAASVGMAQTMIRVTIDSLTTVTIQMPTEGMAVTSLTPRLSGTIERNAQLTLTLDGVALNGAFVDGTQWQIEPPPLSAGTHTLVAIARDENGNQATAVREFVLDRTLIDQDMDGVSDAAECSSNPCPDSDRDGTPDLLDSDDDNDQIPTSVECPSAPCRDTDRDGTPDYLDPDDDNDGIRSIDELFQQLPRDSDRDGIVDHLDTDDDNDGLLTLDECGITCPDSDGDGRQDQIDSDDDGDGLPTARELQDVAMFGNDVDGDGAVNWRDPDADDDGIRDGVDGTGDSDNDGRPNYLDDRDDSPSRDGSVDAGDGGDGGAGDVGDGGDSSTDLDAGVDPRVGVSGGSVLDCSSSSAPARGSTLFAALLLLVGWGVWQRRNASSKKLHLRTRGVAIVGALAVAMSGGRLEAQDVRGRFTLDQFRAAETPTDGFALRSGLGLKHLDVGGRLVFDYAYDALVIEDVRGDGSTQSSSLVEHSLVANLALSMGLFDYFTVYLGLPMVLASEGSAPSLNLSADGTSVGDFYFGVRGRVWGEATDLASFAIQLGMSAPSSPESSRFSGESTAAFVPRLIAELRPHELLDVLINVGARIREEAQIRNLTIGHELTYGLGVRVDVIDEVLAIQGELWGATGFEYAFQRETSPVEFLVGARAQPLCGFRVGAGAGMGMGRGYGAPAARVVLEAAYAYESRCYRNSEARRPARRPTAEDTDGDGVRDNRDRCPDEAEDIDGFEDEDGCPDLDNDLDGIPDDRDGAPNQPEDRDGFEDEDGIPELDNDGDGIEDSRDVAPDDAEDFDGYRDNDGAPEPDNDLDGVLDEEDHCPNTPGQSRYDGCSEFVQIDASGRIVLNQPPTFSARGRLVPRSLANMAEVAALLRDHPRWGLWLMAFYRAPEASEELVDEGHRRAAATRVGALRAWLTEQGIASERLTGWTCAGPREDVQLRLAESATAPEGCVQTE